MTTAEKNYSDIIDISRPASHHPKMPMLQRAAQFAPFAALSGFSEQVQETRRITEQEAELDETVKEELTFKLQFLVACHHPTVAVTYFDPDQHKSGGTYRTHEGTINKIDEFYHVIKFEDGTIIPLERISALESKLLGTIAGEVV